MSCNHMYVTDADKALNMCGLCGVTFDEWREGKISTFKDGVTAERERIIKLLQDDNHPLGRELYDYWEWQDEDHPFPYALIKGEK